jgi:hypothetical protein
MKEVFLRMMRRNIDIQGSLEMALLQLKRQQEEIEVLAGKDEQTSKNRDDEKNDPSS